MCYHAAMVDKKSFPKKEYSARRPPREGDERPRFDKRGKTDGGKFGSGKSAGDKPRGAKPAGDRPYGDKPSFSGKRDQPGGSKFPPRKTGGLRKGPEVSEYEGERIAKVIARAGLGSRRDAEEAIEKGRVEVNGRVIDSPALNVTESDRIFLDGHHLPQRDRTRLWLYHKPKGLVTTEKDPEGRQTVFETLPREMPRVMSVGRLDINTEGLLLLTNDGGLKRVLELPSTGWLRRYRVRAYGTIEQFQLDAIKDGVEIEGIKYGAIEASIERKTGDNVWLIMGIREGKNREIKNIATHLGLTVNRLIRISFGPFQLRDMEQGEIQETSIKLLQDQLGARLMREANIDLSKGNTAIHPTPRLEKHGSDRPTRFSEGRATQKAEAFADLQDSDGRKVATDEQTSRMTLRPKRLQDRKGRDVEVSKSFSENAYLKRKTKRDTPASSNEDAPRRRFSSDGEKREYKARDSGDGEKRSYRQRDSADGEKRSYRPRDSGDGEKRPYRPREASGDKPFRKPYGDRPSGGARGGERGGQRFEKRGDGEKREYKPRDSGDGEKRSYRPREANGDKPFRKPYGDRPSGGARGGQRFEKRGDGEKRSYKPRDSGDGEKRPYRPREPSGDKPFRKPYGDRPSGGERGGARNGQRFEKRGDSEKREYKPRESGDGEKRPYRSRDASGDGEKRAYKPREGAGDRPRFGKPDGKKPFGAKRPSGGGKPGGGRSFGKPGAKPASRGGPARRGPPRAK